MTSRRSVLFALFCTATLFAAPLLSAAEDESTRLEPLTEIMPEDDFAAAGLDKLTAGEREALRQWMERYLAGERRVAKEATAATVAEVEAKAAAALAEAEAATLVAAARAEAAEKAAAEAEQAAAEAEASAIVLPQGEDAFGLEDVRERVVAIFQRDAAPPEVIESRVLGDFRGWSGNTVFRLENGQIWKQAESGDYYLPRKDAVVVIEKGLMGAYYLKVKGKGKRVKVRRLE